MYAQKENNKSDINTKRNNTEKNTEPTENGNNVNTELFLLRS